MYSQSPQRYPSPKFERQQTDAPYSSNPDYYRRSLSNFDLDYDPDMGGYQAVQRTASVMMPTGSERTSILNGFPVSPKTRVMDKKKMKDAAVKFADKTEWKKENVCNVCQKGVDANGSGSRHHCRMCASTVCGSCSSRRINDRRVCDTCFYKKKLEAQEKKMAESLARMDGIALDTKNVLNRTKEDCEYEREKCRQLEAQIDKEAHMQEESLENQSKVKYGFLNNLNKAKEVQQNLNAGIEKNKTLIAEKESKLRSLRTKIATLNLEVTQKSQKFKDMTQTFDGLLKKHKELNEGKNETIAQEEVPGPKRIVAQNYSLLGDDKGKGGKGGKYNISVQPVKI